MEVDASSAEASHLRHLTSDQGAPHTECTVGSESGIDLKPRFGSSAQWRIQTCDTSSLYILNTSSGTDLLGGLQSQLDAKQPAGSYYTTVPNVDNTKISYLSNVTNNIQSQLNAKQAAGSYFMDEGSVGPRPWQCVTQLPGRHRKANFSHVVGWRLGMDH